MINVIKNLFIAKTKNVVSHLCQIILSPLIFLPLFTLSVIPTVYLNNKVSFT